jgi:phosphoglycolate phosphatase
MTSAVRPGLAVFDCDGTLVDSQHSIFSCMNAAFAAEGLSTPSIDSVRRVIGLPLAECMARLAPGEHATRHARLTEAYKTFFFELRQRPDHHEPLFDGALEALDALASSGLVLGIATGKARRGLIAVLERHGIVDRFITLQTSDLAPGKPSPDMLLRAMADAGAGRDDTLMIGDTTFDILMARNAGVRAIGVGWGYHPAEELHAAGADALIASFAELPDAVHRLQRRVSCA